MVPRSSHGVIAQVNCSLKLDWLSNLNPLHSQLGFVSMGMVVGLKIDRTTTAHTLLSLLDFWLSVLKALFRVIQAAQPRPTTISLLEPSKTSQRFFHKWRSTNPCSSCTWYSNEWSHESWCVPLCRWNVSPWRKKFDRRWCNLLQRTWNRPCYNKRSHK